MRMSYRLIRDRTGFIADCLEADAAGEGKTAEEAVECLRQELKERMDRPDAIAPPSHPAEVDIELVLADDRASLSPRRRGGP